MSTDFFQEESLGEKVGDPKNQSFPLNSYPKVICMIYSKQISALNIMILINLLITVWKVKKVHKLFYIWSNFSIHFDKLFHKIKMNKIYCCHLLRRKYKRRQREYKRHQHECNWWCCAPQLQITTPKQQTKLFLHWNISPKRGRRAERKLCCRA